MKKAWSIKAQGNSATIYLYDVIDWLGDNAKKFSQDLAALGDIGEIELRVNSPGGDVFDGMAIYNLLAAHKAKVNVKVDGLAASVASVIMLAGDTVEIASNAMVMVHGPWAYTVGNADKHQKQVELLEKIADVMGNTYKTKTGADDETIKEWMSDDTWFTAQEALDAGLVDSIGEANKVAACVPEKFDLSRFNNVPKSLLKVDTPEPDHNEPEKIETPLRNFWETRMGLSNRSQGENNK